MDLKNIISQQGISLISYNTSNEIKAEEFIDYLKFEVNYDITFEEILSSLKTKKNTKIHISQPLTNIVRLKQSDVLNRAKYLSKFIRQLNVICNSNNLSIVLKSYRYTGFNSNSIPGKITSISGGSSMLYASNFVGIIENDKLIVEKSRYSETKEYDLDTILLRSLRKKKLKNIEKNKTS